MKIKLLKHYEHEILYKPQNKYQDYKFVEDYKIKKSEHYKKSVDGIEHNKKNGYMPLDYYNLNTYVIDPYRNDPLCYIMYPTNIDNLWLYNTNNGLVFTPLQRNYTGFTTYIPPTVFFVAYLEIPYFILYISLGIGKQNVKYLKYKEDGGKIKMSFVDTAKESTKFKYDDVLWTDIINILPYSLVNRKYKK